MNMMNFLFFLSASSALIRMVVPLHRHSLKAIPWLLCFMLCIAMIKVQHLKAPFNAVFIFDPIFDPSPELLEQFELKLAELRSVGMYSAMMLMLDGPESLEPTTWLDSNVSASILFASASRTSTLEVAIEIALQSGDEPSIIEKLWRIFRSRQTRVFVCITEADAWKKRQPVDVGRLATLGYRTEGLIEAIEFSPQPRTLSMKVSRSRALPALMPLSTTGATVSALIRGAELKAFAGQNVQLTIDYQIDDRATCRKLERAAVVTSDGEINFEIPLNKCLAPSGKSPELSPGFAFFQAQVCVSIAGSQWLANSSDYLSVSWTRVQVVFGNGEINDPLAAPGLLDPSHTPITIAKLEEMVGKQLRSPRSGPNTHVDFVTADQFRASLAAGNQLPDILVLDKLPYSIWTEQICKQVADAIKDGRHTIVIDPPAQPKGTTPGELALKKAMNFLPATTSPGRVVGTEPELLLVFDYGRMGELAKTPEGLPGQNSQPISRSIDVQFTAASSLIRFYKDKGLLFGKLELRNDEIAYQTDSRDKVLVRIAPKIDVPGGMLDNLILPSALELRIASLFSSKMLPFMDIDKSGLPDLSTDAQLSEYLRLTPLYAPNRILVAFCMDTPQPNNLASTTEPLGVPALPYTVGGVTTKMLANPDGILTHLILRGVRLAAIRMDIPEATVGDVNYAQGLREMTRTWPVPLAGQNPYGAFTITLEQTLGTKIDDALKTLSPAADPQFFLTSAAAKNRILRKSGSPFFDHLNLTDSGVLAIANTLGEELAREFLPAFESPRSSMAMTAIRNGIIVDERIPLHFLNELDSWIASAVNFDTKWPHSERWSAPRRFRLLDNNADFPSNWRSDYVVAVETRATADTKPIPLVTAGRYGNGICAVMAYDPFEIREPWWKGRDAILDPNADISFADSFGIQRICDFIALCSRIHGVPRDEPRPSQVYVTDARGGIVVEVDFLSGTVLDERLLQAEIISATGTSIPMELTKIDWHRSQAMYSIAAKDLRTLMPDDLPGCHTKIRFGNQGDTNLYVNRPSEAIWVDVTALESLATLSAITGGTLSSHTSVLQPINRHIRVVWSSIFMLVLAGTYTTWALASIRKRFTRRRLDSFTHLSLTPLGIASEVASHVEIGEPVPKHSLNPAEYCLPISSGVEPRAIRMMDLIKSSLGIPVMPQVICRAAQSSATLTILVDAGCSMRVRCDGSYPKIYLAAVAAQMIAEYAIRRGATVKVMVGGLREGWQATGWISSAMPGTIMHFVEQAAKRKPHPLRDLPKIDTDFDQGVTFITDMLTLSSEEILTYARNCRGQGCEFNIVQVISEEEYRSVGMGFWSSPPQLINRLGHTSTEIQAAYKHLAKQFNTLYEYEGFGFVTINDAMTAGKIYESLDDRLFRSRRF